MTTTEQIVYVSGSFLPRSQAHVNAFDRGFLYGDGFFETTRIHAGKALFLSQHIQRLAKSCEDTDWNRQPSSNQLTWAVAELIEKNEVVNGYLRITVSRGPYEGGLTDLEAKKPTILIEARNIETLPPLDQAPPFTITRSEYAKNDNSLTVGHKSLSYQENLMALAQARRRGSDEVYFLNTKGYLTEGAISNLFWTQEGTVFTPAVQCGLLPGITRKVILELCEELDIPYKTGHFPESYLLDADEIFCTNSLRGVIPVTKILTKEASREYCCGAMMKLLTQNYKKLCEGGVL